MEYKLIECNYLVYLDILKKSNVGANYLKTIELINDLIKKSYVNESYCLIRLLFEEIMYDLVLKIDSNYSLTIKTSPKKIRKFVTDNREKLFGDLYDEIYFDNIYEYLSKMTHATSLKEYVNEIVKKKDFQQFMKINQMCIFLTVIHILIVSSTLNFELIELSNYLVFASNWLLLSPTLALGDKISDNDKKKYNKMFKNENDQDYLLRKVNETRELFESLDNDEIKNKRKQSAEKLQVLLIKYGYNKFYD